MFYVTDKKAKSAKANFADFNFSDVASDKKALWRSNEDAYYAVACFIKDNHAGDKAYTMSRYEICEEKA